MEDIFANSRWILLMFFKLNFSSSKERWIDLDKTKNGDLVESTGISELKTISTKSLREEFRKKL